MSKYKTNLVEDSGFDPFNAVMGDLGWSPDAPIAPPVGPSEFARRCLGEKWMDPPHVRMLDEELVKAADGRLAKEGYIGLIVEMPPRHGKSTTTSHWFPSWYLGAFPEKKVILTSYEADFASSWGRRCRDTLQEFGGEVFGVKIRQDSSAASRWEIEHYEGGMVTAGAGGPITGKGGHILLCDDPIKNAEEADSEVHREKLWDWYLSTFRTRLEPDGSIVIVLTRWHDDDIAGRILARMASDPGADQFKRVRLAALAEEDDPLGRAVGEALWPERYPVQALEAIRASVGTRVWSSLYQQNPRRQEGGFFQKRPTVVERVPGRIVRWVRGWDKAATAETGKNEPDWTVGAKLGIDETNRVVIGDIKRLRGAPADVEKLIRETAMEDGPEVSIRLEQEPGSSGKTDVDFFVRHVLRGFDVKGDKATGSKVTRARPLASYVESGNVYMLRGWWNEVLWDEMDAFPNGRHDDMVDACSLAFKEFGVINENVPAVLGGDVLTCTPGIQADKEFRLFRSLVSLPQINVCSWFQVRKDVNGQESLIVLAERHAQDKLLPVFWREVEVFTRERFGDLLADNCETWFPVGEMPPVGAELAVLGLIRSLNCDPVQWVYEPERAIQITMEAIRDERVIVAGGAEVITQSLATGYVRDRMNRLLEDGFWEPLARSVLLPCLGVFEFGGDPQGPSHVRQEGVLTPTMQRLHRGKSVAPAIDGVFRRDRQPDQSPRLLDDVRTQTCYRPKAVGLPKQKGRKYGNRQ